jgi:hypothetical protein
LSGTTLELYTPSIYSNIICGQNNYLGMVKEVKIGISAAKFLGKTPRKRFNDYNRPSCEG